MKKIQIFIHCVVLFFTAALQANVSVENLAEKQNLVAVAVIGSGSSGLGASFVTSSKKYHTVVFQGQKLRGNLDHEKPVKNWLGAPLTPGKEIMQHVEDQAHAKGAHITQDPIVSVDLSQYPYQLTTASGTHVHALSIIIATGTSHMPLEVEGVSEYEGKGILYDVSKHDATWHNKRIVVIGSGDDAISKATRLAANAKDVSIVVRSDTFKAEKDAIDKLFKENPHVHALFSSQVTKITGDNEKITGVGVVIEGREYEIPCDIVVAAIGRKPNSALFEPHIKQDASGYITLTPFTQKTSLEAVFAAGSVADSTYVQAFISCSDGMKAGCDAAKYLHAAGFTQDLQEKLSSSLYNPTDLDTPDAS